jgi:hypothetical protein
MLDVQTGGDALKVLWIAAATGAATSLVSELVIARGVRKETGMVELPGRRGPRFWDLGSFASIPVGVVAAVVAAFLFAPGEQTMQGAQLVRKLELDRLLLVAAVAGLSSAGFLALVQERFLAAAKNQRLDTALTGALGGLDDIKHEATKPDADKAQIAAKVDALKTTVKAAAQPAHGSP